MLKTAAKRGFFARLANFWYYYKWYTVVALVVAVTVAVSVTQCVRAPKYDYTLLLASSEVQFSNAQITALEQQLSAYAADLNGDGTANVRLLDCTYSSAFSTREVVNGQRQKLQSQLMNNSGALLIITDDASFNWLNSITEGGFMENLNLPLNNGRAVDLNLNGLYTAAQKQCDSSLQWPKALKLSRRIVKNTLIERDEKMAENLKNNNDFLNRFLSNTKAS